MTPEDPDYEPDDGTEEVSPTQQVTVDASNPKQVRKAERKASRIATEDKEFMISVLRSALGRRFLWNMMVSAGGALPELPFMAGPVGFPDTNATFYKMGQRDFALYLYRNWLQLDHQAVYMMHAENDPRFVSRPTNTKRDSNARSG